MVAFLVYCAALQPLDAPMLWSAATLAAIINMLGPVMSISGNELALRFGRQRVIFTFMTLSGATACVLGFTAALPWLLVFLLMCVHYGLMLGDSAALTSGAIASAPPGLRGASMAIYSLVGFTAAFLAPLVFGVVLDLAGGNRSTLAWDWRSPASAFRGAVAGGEVDVRAEKLAIIIRCFYCYFYRCRTAAIFRALLLNCRYRRGQELS